MNNEDYIMRQIQQLTQVLNKILTKILKVNPEVSQTQSIDILNKTFVSELDFELQDILSIENETDINSFSKKYGFNTDQINILTDILFEVADRNFENQAQHIECLQIFSKCLFLYHYLEKSENIYSVDRNLRISKIESLM